MTKVVSCKVHSIYISSLFIKDVSFVILFLLTFSGMLIDKLYLFSMGVLTVFESIKIPKIWRKNVDISIWITVLIDTH